MAEQLPRLQGTLPTHGEGLSRTVIEAVVYGMPPLVTATGGNIDLVIDGECGLLLPVNDAAALAHVMERLYDDPEVRIGYGAAARERIGGHFKSEDSVLLTLDLYLQLPAL